MPIYEFTNTEIRALQETTFNLAGLQERRDLQRLLRAHVEVIAPDTLVISEEFGEWEDSRRRIDLLAIDKNANLVVIDGEPLGEQISFLRAARSADEHGHA